MLENISRNSRSCEHTSHLFKNPFCKDLSLFRRVANAIFHIFTLGIPFAIYTVISCCSGSASLSYGDRSRSNLDIPPYQQPITHDVRFVRGKYSISDLGKGVINSVLEEVDTRHDIKLVNREGFVSESDSTYHPPEEITISPRLEKLQVLHLEKYNNLLRLLKEHKTSPDPWVNKNVIDAADAVIKTSYALGMLMLEEVPDLQDGVYGRSYNNYAEFLGDRQNDQFATAHMLPRSYHAIRSGVVWDDNSKRGAYIIQNTPQDYAQKFYTDGEIHDTWRQLYNEYSNYIRFYTSDQEMNNIDVALASWTCPDHNDQQYRLKRRGINPLSS